jgi:flagellar protein FlgJ
MEIAGFESAYLDSMRDNFRLSSPSSPVHNPLNFAEILERAKANQDDGSGTVSGTTNGSIDKTDKLYQLCLELETFIVKNLLNGMRNTVQKSGLIDDSFAGKMYEDMLYDEYAKDFAKNANFGLAEQAYRQLTRYNS